MATYTEETKRVLRISEAATNIVKTIDPLSQRSKRRVLLFFYDLVQDPAEEFSFAQLEILKEVATQLDIDLT